MNISRKIDLLATNPEVFPLQTLVKQPFPCAYRKPHPRMKVRVRLAVQPNEAVCSGAEYLTEEPDRDCDSGRLFVVAYCGQTFSL